jgi:hypothetical protein
LRGGIESGDRIIEPTPPDMRTGRGEGIPVFRFVRSSTQGDGEVTPAGKTCRFGARRRGSRGEACKQSYWSIYCLARFGLRRPSVDDKMVIFLS